MPSPAQQLTFTDVSADAGLPSSFQDTIGVQWGDYDNDGDPDVHMSLSHYGQTTGEVAKLYRNNGDGTFTDRLIQAGLTANFDRHGCSWGDYDSDGDLDFACSSGANSGTQTNSFDHVWRNNGNGTFTDVAAALGIVDGLGRGRSAMWLDYDGDQDMDLFIANDERVGAPTRLYRNNGGTSSTDVWHSPERRSQQRYRGALSSTTTRR